MRSDDILKTYLNFHKIHGQQNCQGGDILRGTPNEKPLMRWSCELISQIKSIPTPFAKDPWTLN